MRKSINIRIRPWLRRLITRLIAIVPAVIVAILGGESGTAKLLILSQVVLSLQLSFAVFPLVMFTSNKLKMGEFVNPVWLKVLAFCWLWEERLAFGPGLGDPDAPDLETRVPPLPGPRPVGRVAPDRPGPRQAVRWQWILLPA